MDPDGREKGCYWEAGLSGQVSSFDMRNSDLRLTETNFGSHATECTFTFYLCAKIQSSLASDLTTCE